MGASPSSEIGGGSTLPTTRNVQLFQLVSRLTPLRAALLKHPLFDRLDSLQGMRRFMEYHVFIVWDRLVLVKTLQRLWGRQSPGTPADGGVSERWIRDLVRDEESYDDGRGGFVTNLELYHRAMCRAGADTSQIERIAPELQRRTTAVDVSHTPGLPLALRDLGRHLVPLVESGDPCRIAGAVLLGREYLLPPVFHRRVCELNARTGGALHEFELFLNRQLARDSVRQGRTAGQILMALCGAETDKWQTVEAAGQHALLSWRSLWDTLAADLATEGSASPTAGGGVVSSLAWLEHASRVGLARS